MNFMKTSRALYPNFTFFVDLLHIMDELYSKFVFILDKCKVIVYITAEKKNYDYM